MVWLGGRDPSSTSSLWGEGEFALGRVGGGFALFMRTSFALSCPVLVGRSKFYLCLSSC